MNKSPNIIDKIKNKGIKQRPKWHFTLLRLFRRVCYVLCILIGAISFSIILFASQQSDFDLFSHMSHSRLELFLAILPFFWVILLLIFLAFAVIIFRKSSRGYKYHWLFLFGISAASSILIGTLFFKLGGAHQLEKAFATRVSAYESIQKQKVKAWSNPESGFLAGTLDEISKNNWQLIDFNNNYWKIEIEEALISRPVQLESGEKVKLVGDIIKANHFKAIEIRPWDGKRANIKSHTEDLEN